MFNKILFKKPFLNYVAVTIFICALILSAIKLSKSYNISTENKIIENQKIHQLVNYNYSSVTKITLLNGKTGKSTLINDKENINEFTQHLKTLTLVKSKDQSEKIGYLYSIKLYNEAEGAIHIILNDQMNINNTFYDIAEEDATIANFKEFTDSLAKNDRH
ncbi:hypothetical protein [Desnuesiella massiliensis]|uniref:hypothetical protein n=1 Tax=Desnuesiella massiliensis TaxID=1650662 RepID=UPI0006E22020|nr:hypothetical protein [Desnuesiella massiliensis]